MSLAKQNCIVLSTWFLLARSMLSTSLMHARNLGLLQAYTSGFQKLKTGSIVPRHLQLPGQDILELYMHAVFYDRNTAQCSD